MRTLFYRFRHWWNKHEYKDYSVPGVIAYYCEDCYLQKTSLGDNHYWYRVAPWLKDNFY